MLFPLFHFQKPTHVFQTYGASVDPFFMLRNLWMTQKTHIQIRQTKIIWKHTWSHKNLQYQKIQTWKTTCTKLQSTICTSHLSWTPLSSALKDCPTLYWVKCGYGQSFRYCFMKHLWGLSGTSSKLSSTVDRKKSARHLSYCFELPFHQQNSLLTIICTWTYWSIYKVHTW